MKIVRARKALDDTSFLKGSTIRASALKELAEMEEPEAAEALVSAVDENSPSATKAQELLEADRKPGWGDKLWMIWAQKRQPWLRKTLQTRGTIFSRPDCRIGILSRLVLGGQWKADAGTAKLVSAFVNDPDLQVQGAARQYFDGLQKHVPKLWMETLLRAKLFTRINSGRKAAEVLSSFLHSDMCTLACSATECLATWPVADRALALLLAGKESELPVDQAMAFAVSEYQHDVRQIVAMGATVYLDRVMASGTDFTVALAFKSGRPAKLSATPPTILEALGLLLTTLLWMTGFEPRIHMWASCYALGNGSRPNPDARSCSVCCGGTSRGILRWMTRIARFLRRLWLGRQQLIVT
jgi:hypothetical protein